eukprot:COSAG01_NODE_7097_length_3354_cov_1.632985_4_plen_70_part_00
MHASARGGGGSSGLQPWSGVRTLITHARRVLSDVSVWYLLGAGCPQSRCRHARQQQGAEMGRCRVMNMK